MKPNPPKRRRKTETEYTRMARARRRCIENERPKTLVAAFYFGWQAAMREARKRGRT